MIKTYEKAKFLVTRNVFFFTCISMCLLALVNFITNGSNLLTSIIAVFFSASVLIYLLKSKTYLIPAIIAIILGYALNFSNLLRASNFENYIDLFWLINLSLFAYFTLGKWIGHFYLFLNISTLFVISILDKLNYITLTPASNIYDFGSYLDLAINIIICTLFFSYLISQFLKQTNIAKDDSIRSNLELQKQHDEKSIMLKEIHHRVKNNLQVITSLLRLQSHQIEDPETAAPFNESIDRISSMALIHEKMYQGDTIKNIDLKEYIQDLAENLLANYSNNKNISLVVNSTVNTIELNHIVPLSLIVNELISNSLKHAFNQKTEGKIEITISSNNSTQLTLCYNDNGVWKTPKNKSSFGLELIDTFTEQLDGAYTFNSINGTEYCFYFKEIIIKK